MKLILLLTIFICIFGCATPPKTGDIPLDLEISEEGANKKTALTKQNVKHLAQVYDIAPFLFSKKIKITSTSNSRAYPVLTLDTKYAENPNKLLAQLLHEELHWWAIKKAAAMKAAIEDLKKIYPQIPRETKLKASYAHLIICYLEHEALIFYLGKKQARTIILDFIKVDKIFPWAYSQVLNKSFAIKGIVEKHKLLPFPLT